VLPKPDGPIADDVLDDGTVEDVDEELGVLVDEPPRRLVAAVNAADAFGAELVAVVVVPEELELAAEEDVEAVVDDVDESRPRSARLPRSRGVISDA
jgi:2-phospho-L-lactate guanylyltransferase (CobY/MobA/RfbA family)